MGDTFKSRGSQMDVWPSQVEKKKKSGGGAGGDMVGAFTQLGDKLHNNFSNNLNSAFQNRMAVKQMDLQEGNMMYGRTRSMMDELQRRREALFGEEMTERGMQMSERESALRTKAEEYQLRKVIEGDQNKEAMTKNFMLGMMSSINTGGQNG